MDEEKWQELLRLAWMGGFHVKSVEEKERLEKALMLAVLEGWDAESEDSVDYMLAAF